MIVIFRIYDDGNEIYKGTEYIDLEDIIDTAERKFGLKAFYDNEEGIYTFNVPYVKFEAFRNYIFQYHGLNYDEE